MVEEWQESWEDEASGEEIYWAYIRPKNEEELKEVKKEYEEYKVVAGEKAVDFELWAECEEADVMNVLERPKTKEEFEKSALLINIEGGNEGAYAFKKDAWDIPSFEEADDWELSDYSKLRILNLVTEGYLDQEIVCWIFRNDLMNQLTDNGKISDEEFTKLNKLSE